jgi:hypothetical protein
MSVQARPRKLKQTRWWELALRFAFGGLCTVIAGLVAKKFGPAAGGLFLAFPAIFPSGASLIASHEKERKHKAGMHGTRRGCELAGVDAAGATMGCAGLAAFAVVVWQGVAAAQRADGDRGGFGCVGRGVLRRVVAVAEARGDTAAVI